MTINDEIKSLVDVVLMQGKLVESENVNKCVDLTYSYIANGYKQSRECIQFTIGQLYRIPSASLKAMLPSALESIEKFSKKNKKTNHSISYINNDVSNEQFGELLGKVSSKTTEIFNISELYPEIAETFTLEERKKVVGGCVNAAQTIALKMDWDDVFIYFLAKLECVMYSICKKDAVMDLFFEWNGNIVDGLNKSSQYQLARDYTESLLIIGHREGLIAEAYFNASRTYTWQRKELAGLLYLNISLIDLNKRSCIQKEFAFDVIWQMLKIMRGVQIYTQPIVDGLLRIYDSLEMQDYNTLSIYYTALGIGFVHDVNAAANRVELFLREKEKIILHNKTYSAAPWYSLIREIKHFGASGHFPVMEKMEKMMKEELLRIGNKRLIDILEDKDDQTNLLKAELSKLETTRNPEDFGADSNIAIRLAQNVLDRAFLENNAADFILAMRPKSDYSFVMSDKNQNRSFKQIEVVNTKGNECKLLYSDTDALTWLTLTEISDCIIWIGKGNKSAYQMTLVDSMYKFDNLQSFKVINSEKLQKEIISKLAFNRIAKDVGGVYQKSDYELNEEYNHLFKQMNDCKFPIPNIVSRLFLIKDMELSAIPHQLMIDERSAHFIGELCPSANVISVEFLIKSNFNSPLPKNFTKSYWSPINRDNILFRAKEYLEHVLTNDGFLVDINDYPSFSLHADLNIVCAHGSKNISETELLYAGGEPIINSDSIIGPGKILVLFVCHSGSITHQYYDNSIHTVVKRYLRMGYGSVIAPMWSLNIEILPIWLENFMRVIDNGGYVVDAVYKANMKVKEKFISPTAWACLHLFGNPYTQIGDKPILYEKNEP